MKKVIFALVVVLFSTAMFAQDQKDKKMVSKPEKSENEKASLHCYAMKDNAMVECWGTKHVAMTNDSKLKNGTKVSTKGEVVMKNGKKATLQNGQCIMAKGGVIGDFDKMHAGDMMHNKMKMHEKN